MLAWSCFYYVYDDNTEVASDCLYNVIFDAGS